jgi:hypothetical protein
MRQQVIPGMSAGSGAVNRTPNTDIGGTMKGIRVLAIALALLGSLLVLQGTAAAGSPIYDCVWTGGGKISGLYLFPTPKPMIVDYSLLLACPPEQPPQPYDPSGVINVYWLGNRFTMTDLQTVNCYASGGRGITGSGTGKVNYKPGYTIVFTIVDNQAAGTRDQVDFYITGPNGFIFDTGTANVYIGGHRTHHCEFPDS